MSRNKDILLTAAFFGLGFWALRTRAQKFLNKLEYQVTNARFVSGNQFVLEVFLKNNDPLVPLFLKGATGKIYHHDNVLASFAQSDTIKIAPGRSETVQIVSSIDYNNIVQNAQNLLENANNDFIEIHTKLDFGGFSIPLASNYSLLELVS